ncbi:MAG: hypothetical protein ACXQTM_00340 [Methanosarcinales archaeon]
MSIYERADNPSTAYQRPDARVSKPDNGVIQWMMASVLASGHIR